MSINQRQYQQLTEMGISLWQRKNGAFDHSSSNKHSAAPKKDYIKTSPQYLNALAKQTIFTDILSSLALSIGEVTPKQDHLDLGLFNWYFTVSEQAPCTIQCTGNNLISPSIKLISQSPALKKQLWHTIINSLL